MPALEIDEKDLPPVEETLERESRTGRPAGIAAILAGVFTLAGGIVLGTLPEFPEVLLLEALREAAGERTGEEGLLVERVRFYDENALAFNIGSGLIALGALLLLPPFLHLLRAIRARNPLMSKTWIPFIVGGPVLLAVAALVRQVALTINANDFFSGTDRTSEAARDALQEGVITVVPLFGLLGNLGVAVGFVVLALNAMRVGLLTRFMGVLGVITGFLLIIPLAGQVPIVQTYWLIALGVLLLGIWPGAGVPPAWRTGRAEPWPSQQELRERREREQATESADDEMTEERPSGDPSDPRDAPPAHGGNTPGPGTAKPHSSSKKRKRKRR